MYIYIFCHTKLYIYCLVFAQRRDHDTSFALKIFTYMRNKWSEPPHTRWSSSWVNAYFFFSTEFTTTNNHYTTIIIPAYKTYIHIFTDGLLECLVWIGITGHDGTRLWPIEGTYSCCWSRQCVCVRFDTRKKAKHHIKSPASEHICASQASTRRGVRQFPSNRGTKLRKPTVILVK